MSGVKLDPFDSDRASDGGAKSGDHRQGDGFVALLDRSQLAMQDRHEEVAVTAAGSRNVFSTNSRPVSNSSRTLAGTRSRFPLYQRQQVLGHELGVRVGGPAQE
jgi:hypothetical protein